MDEAAAPVSLPKAASRDEESEHALIESAVAVNSASELDDALRLLVQPARDLLGADLVTLVAWDEGLSTCLMSSPRLEQIGKLLKLPETAIPVCLMSVGYPAESWEAGGQTSKHPFRELFSEMEHGKPFGEDPEVIAEMERDGMIQAPAPLPWRDAELKYLSHALNLEWQLAIPSPQPRDGEQ